MVHSCDLFDFISSCGTLSEDVASEKLKQVVDTLTDCQYNRALHGDITDENILTDLDTGKASSSWFHAGVYSSGMTTFNCHLLSSQAVLTEISRKD